jgi:membrane-associated phospholipid phosphatase
VATAPVTSTISTERSDTSALRERNLHPGYEAGMTATDVPTGARTKPPGPSSRTRVAGRSTTVLARRPGTVGAGMLDPRAGSPADRLGHRLAGHHPASVAAMVGVAGAAVLTTLMLGIGLLVTSVLSHGPVGRLDRSVDRWFADQRAPGLNDVTAYGSSAANTETVVFIAAVVVVLVALRRHWRAPVLLAVGLGAEVTVFLATTFLVDRPRPAVHRLDTVPPTSSFPSGHTAAAVVLYVGLALLCNQACQRAALCALAWVAGVLLPAAVGIARMYRGMHHLTDVLAGALLGVACLVLAVFAVRTVATVIARRHAGEGVPS